MGWRRICIRYLCRRRGLVPRDRDLEEGAGSAAAEDFLAGVLAVGAGARSRSAVTLRLEARAPSHSSIQIARMIRVEANVVRPERLELPTLCSEGRCSIQLSYGRSQEYILRQTRL